MRIAVAGKGGSGKTTIAAAVARLGARAGRRVLALDGDSNPNLASALGLPRDAVVPTVPRDVLEMRERTDGTRAAELVLTPREIATRFGLPAPDGVTLVVMGRVGHAGAG